MSNIENYNYLDEDDKDIIAIDGVDFKCRDNVPLNKKLVKTLKNKISELLNLIDNKTIFLAKVRIIYVSDKLYKPIITNVLSYKADNFSKTIKICCYNENDINVHVCYDNFENKHEPININYLTENLDNFMETYFDLNGNYIGGTIHVSHYKTKNNWHKYSKKLE